MSKKKLLIRILILVLIGIALTSIWIIKTHSKPISINEETGENSDFELAASSINLDELKEYNLPIIIDFGSDSCIPCQQMAPVLETMNEEMQGKAIIKFVDVWKYEDAATDFPIQVIPTQVIYSADGKPYTPDEDLGIDFYMWSAEDTNEHIFTTHQGGLTEDQMRAILKDMGVE